MSKKIDKKTWSKTCPARTGAGRKAKWRTNPLPGKGQGPQFANWALAAGAPTLEEKVQDLYWPKKNIWAGFLPLLGDRYM